MELHHEAQMRTLGIVGIVAGILAACMGGAMVGMVLVNIRTGRPEIAIIVAMFGTVQSILTGFIGLMMPSPMQQGQRRTEPTGTPRDPVSVTEVEAAPSVAESPQTETAPEATDAAGKGDG